MTFDNEISTITTWEQSNKRVTKNHSQAVCPPEDGHPPSSSNRALDIVDRDHTPRRHEAKQTDDVGPPYSRTKSFAARMWARQEQL